MKEKNYTYNLNKQSCWQTIIITKMTRRCIKENQFKTTQKATEFNIKFNEDIHLRLSHYSNHINRFILEETD